MSYTDLYQRLLPHYPPHEAQAIVRLLLEEKFGLSPADIYSGKVNELSAEATTELEKMMYRLENAEPIQYVLGMATFCHRSFFVSPAVLIPRPETEVLCQWITSDLNQPFYALHPPIPTEILDIGTGSGCIAITLALDVFNASVTACDLSGDALLVARKNAIAHNVTINFQLNDALNMPSVDKQYDLIVSNPPYICEQEKTEMQPNVLHHEPHTALFVPDDDPLRFYLAIATYGRTTLTKGGSLYFETNPQYIHEVESMLSALGYRLIEKRNDQFGKLRFIKAQNL